MIWRSSYRIPILVITLLFSMRTACADYLDNPPALAGFTHSLFSHDSLDGNGLQVSGRAFGISSPVIAEIDGDPTNGMEVAAAAPEGRLYVYSSSGALLWSVRTPNADCAGNGNRLFSSPAVGELYGDGVPYVVIGYGAIGTSCDGGVLALRGSDGARKWLFSTIAFAQKRGFKENFHGVFSTPALADVDHDGKMEVGFGALDRNVYLLNSNGKPRWYYNAADTVWSSPAFANVDDDDDLEMLIGTDITKNDKLSPKTINGGMIYALKTKARKPVRIGFRELDGVVWYKMVEQVVQSSPAIADVLPDNPGAELVVASGCFFPQSTNQKVGRWIKVLRLSDGEVLKTLPIDACSNSSVAIGDIDEDGQLEIVATVNGAGRVGGDGTSSLVAWKADGSEPLWEVTPKVRGRNNSLAGLWQSPVIADLDGNGSLEVAVSSGSGVAIFRGADGAPLTCVDDDDCGGAQDTTLYAWGNITSTPAIGDIDGDGELELVTAGQHSGARRYGFLYAWTNFSELLGSSAGIHPPFSTPWPMFRKNAHRDGAF